MNQEKKKIEVNKDIQEKLKDIGKEILAQIPFGVTCDKLVAADIPVDPFHQSMLASWLLRIQEYSKGPEKPIITLWEAFFCCAFGCAGLFFPLYPKSETEFDKAKIDLFWVWKTILALPKERITDICKEGDRYILPPAYIFEVDLIYYMALLQYLYDKLKNGVISGELTISGRELDWFEKNATYFVSKNKLIKFATKNMPEVLPNLKSLYKKSSRKEVLERLGALWNTPEMKNLNKTQFLDHPKTQPLLKDYISLAKSKDLEQILNHLKRELIKYNPSEQSSKRGRPKKI